MLEFEILLKKVPNAVACQPKQYPVTALVCGGLLARYSSYLKHLARNGNYCELQEDVHLLPQV